MCKGSVECVCERERGSERECIFVFFVFEGECSCILCLQRVFATVWVCVYVYDCDSLVRVFYVIITLIRGCKNDLYNTKTMCKQNLIQK